MPTTLLRSTGTTDVVSNIPYGVKASFRLSNGNVLYLMMDRNQSAVGGEGDNSGTAKCYVYERDEVTDVVSLRATVATGTVEFVTGAVFSNNDLAIVWKNTAHNQLKYAKLTYSGYSLGSIETALDVSGDGDNAGNVEKIMWVDVDVTDDGAVLVAHTRYRWTNGLGAPYNTQGIYSAIQVRNTANVWVNNAIALDLTVALNRRDKSFESIAVSSLGGTATARRIVVACSVRSYDWGLINQHKLYTALVNTTTGVISSVAARTSQSTYAISPGEALSNTVKSGGGQATQIWRKPGGAGDSYVLITANGTGWYTAKGTWDGTTHTFIVNFLGMYWTGYSQALGQVFSLGWKNPAFSYDGTKVNIYVLVIVGNSGYRVANYITDLDITVARSSVQYIEGKMDWPNEPAIAISSSGNRNFSIDSHDVAVQYGLASGKVRALYTKVPTPGGGSAISGLSPANGVTLLPAQPTLSGSIDTEVNVDWTKYKLQFQFAENNTFTVGLLDYVQPDAKFVEVSYTDQIGVAKAFSDVFPVASGSLHAGVWYYRARLVNEAGQVGNWTSTNTITIGHPPVLTPIAPGASRLLIYGSGNVDFSWSFTDPSVGDFQTAYQVVVRNEETGATIFDTGKVVSGVKFHVGAIASGNKDKLLSWQVRGWDSDDANGLFSEKALFFVTDPPVVTITSPTAGSTVTTPRPNIVFTVTTGGSRTISEGTVVVSQAGVTLWTKRVLIGGASGVSTTVRVDPGILTDGQSYSVQVRAVDSSSLVGVSGITAFTADWTPPAAPAGVAVSVSSFNTESQGYVSVTWDNTTNDSNFVYYIVYRRDDLINPNTGAVLEVGVQKVVYIQYNSSAANEFRDYSAPSNYKVNYLVRQVSRTNSAELESANTTFTSSFPVSDGYWLVQVDEAGNTVDAFKLSIVTGDSYTNEQEESELVVIGRGRVVNKGQDMGVKGGLDARLRDTGIYTARQKKRKLEAIVQRSGNLFMRNPFGDTLRVNVSQIAISRIAGVAGAEFCDVTVPYAEVSE